jgi:hypothetical protein
VPCIPSHNTDAQIGVLATYVATSEAKADQVAARWLTNRPTREDKAFLTFAPARVGTPSTAQQRATEIAAMHQITGTKDALKTSAWWELHCKKDIWTLLRTQYRLGIHVGRKTSRRRPTPPTPWPTPSPGGPRPR